MPSSLSEDLIRKVYRETIDPLYAFISRRCGGDRDLAEDVVQEAWLRAVREWSQRDVPVNPLAWLKTVSRNVLLNELRKRQPLSIDSIPQEEVLQALDNDVVSDSAYTAAIVTQALARLPVRQSHLLESFHFERCRVSQLATSLGLSERAIEGRLRRARESLRRELEALAHPHGGFQ